MAHFVHLLAFGKVVEKVEAARRVAGVPGPFMAAAAAQKRALRSVSASCRDKKAGCCADVVKVYQTALQQNSRRREEQRRMFKRLKFENKIGKFLDLTDKQEFNSG